MGRDSSSDQRCPTQERLAAFLAGEIPHSECESIEDHINGCENCLLQLENLNSTPVGVEQYFKNRASLDTFFHEPQLKALKTRVGMIELSRTPAWTQTRSVDSTKVIRRPFPTHLREYEIIRPLGGGGMGDVYVAKHVLLDTIVAIKFLADRHARKSERVQRFRNEMKAIGNLEHPNIVTARDAGEFEGRHYLVMEYVEGLDVSKVVAAQGQLRECDAAEIARQAARGLQYIHDATRIHRDIKPSNLMVAKSGEVRILDLGLAKFTQPSEQIGELTRSGYILGTLDYMAPEQADDSSRADIRSDIYSLGCCLHKLVTGSAPFETPEFDSTFAKLDAHRKRDPVSVSELRPDLSAGLASIIQQMLMKDPSARFQTPAEIADAIEPFAEGSDLRHLAQNSNDEDLIPEDHSAKPKAVNRVMPKPRLKRKPLSSVLALVLLLVVGIATASAWSVFSPNEQDHENGIVPERIVTPLIRVEPLVWDEDSKSSNWKVSEDSAITVQAEDVSLLSVATTTDDFRYAMDFKQFPWSRQIGVFFGYEIRDGEGSYQSLEVESTRGRSFQLVRYQRTFSAHKPLYQNTVRLAGVPIDDPGAACRLKLAIQNKQLTSVTLDGRELPELCRIEPNVAPSSAGRFGVFNNNSSGRFFNIQVDSLPLELK